MARAALADETTTRLRATPFRRRRGRIIGAPRFLTLDEEVFPDFLGQILAPLHIILPFRTTAELQGSRRGSVRLQTLLAQGIEAALNGLFHGLLVRLQVSVVRLRHACKPARRGVASLYLPPLRGNRVV